MPHHSRNLCSINTRLELAGDVCVNDVDSMHLFCKHDIVHGSIALMDVIVSTDIQRTLQTQHGNST